MILYEAIEDAVRDFIDQPGSPEPTHVTLHPASYYLLIGSSIFGHADHVIDPKLEMTFRIHIGGFNLTLIKDEGLDKDEFVILKVVSQRYKVSND